MEKHEIYLSTKLAAEAAAGPHREIRAILGVIATARADIESPLVIVDFGPGIRGNKSPQSHRGVPVISFI